MPACAIPREFGRRCIPARGVALPRRTLQVRLAQAPGEPGASAPSFVRLLTQAGTRSAWRSCLLGVLLLGTGCREKEFYLPGENGSEWLQAGGTAAAHSFAPRDLQPPLKQLWNQKIDAAPLGPPFFAGNAVLQLTAAGSIYAFEIRSGRLLGRRPGSAAVCAAPLLAGRMLVFAEAGKEPRLRAFDRLTRQLRWTVPTEAAVCAPLAGRNDTLVAAVEAGVLQALRASTGERLWQARLGGRLRVAAAMGAEEVYAGDGSGLVAAFELGDGTRRWSRQLDDAVRARPVAAEDRVFVGTAAGTVLALSAGSGEVVWRARVGALPAPGMALGPGVLVVGSADHHVHGLDPRSGARRWSYATGGVVRSSPAIAGGTVYCGSSDQHLYALDSESGRLLWKYRLNGPAQEAVALGPGVVGIASENKRIYVFAEH